MVKKTYFNAKVTEIEDKIPSITDLATNSALIVVKNKIPNVSSLIKKADYDTKVSEIEKKITDHNHDKHITNPEFNTLAADVFNARLAEVNVITKTDFHSGLQSLSKRITSNKAKHLLVENELKKLKKFDSSCFKDKNYFDNDVTQNYLVFQPGHNYFKTINIIGNTSGWKSQGLSNESIKTPSTSNYSVNPLLVYVNSKIRVKFSGSFLKQDKVTYSHGTIVNIYIVFDISKNDNISSYPTLENRLFGTVSLTKNADIDQYKYSGYGIGFDRKVEFW